MEKETRKENVGGRNFYPDWIIHYVSDDCRCDICGKEGNDSGMPGFADIHTHGFEKHGHREVCIPFPIPMDVARDILNDLGTRITRCGYVLEEGINDTILVGYDVKVVSVDGDSVLYMLMPDKNNLFPGDEGCCEPYSHQQEYVEMIAANHKKTD